MAFFFHLGIITNQTYYFPSLKRSHDTSIYSNSQNFLDQFSMLLICQVRFITENYNMAMTANYFHFRYYTDAINIYGPAIDQYSGEWFIFKHFQ